MRKSVSKLKTKEFICIKGSYKDDHDYVQTSTKFFYNSKQKNPKNECTLRNGCIIRCPNDLTRWFQHTSCIWISWWIRNSLECYMHILSYLQYTSSHMFKFLLGPKAWRNKTEESYFSTVPQIIAACFIPPKLSGSRILFFCCGMMIYSSFLIILLYIYVF